MTLGREELWAWLKTAPLPVVLTICLTTSGALTAWVWALTGRVETIASTAQLAVEKAETAKTLSQAQDETQTSRLERLEDKIDALLRGVAELKANEAAQERDRVRKEKNR